MIKFFIFACLSMISNEIFTQDWSIIGDTIHGEANYDEFGWRTKLSSNGNRIVISGPDNSNTNGNDAGHIRVYELFNNQWVQMGQDLIGDAPYNAFGLELDFSSDGKTIIIGAPYNNDNGPSCGLVKCFKWDGFQWVQKGQVIYGENNEQFGGSGLSISNNGEVIAIGARLSDENGSNSGLVKIFNWNGSQWLQKGQSLYGFTNSFFGTSTKLSGDGNSIIISYPGDANDPNSSPVVMTYNWDGFEWVQRGLLLTVANSYSNFGYIVDMSSDGNTIAIGAPSVISSNSTLGKVFVSKWAGNYWQTVGSPIVGSTLQDGFGSYISLSGDGNVIAISAPYNSESSYLSGQVKIYKLLYNNWLQVGNDINGDIIGDQYASVSLSYTGDTLSIGSIQENNIQEYPGKAMVYNCLNCNVATVQNLYNELNLVYPNPTNDFINIKMDNVHKVQIVNLMGQIVYSKESKLDITSISVSSLSKGVYTIIIGTDEKEVTDKIIII